MSKLFYGVESLEIFKIQAMHVCEVLGHGKNRVAFDMLIETAAAETQLATYPDRFVSNGFGVMQFDGIAVRDVINRTRREVKKIIWETWGYDLDTVRPKQLCQDPLLSLIFARLKYRLIPDCIPIDIVSRAAYWKRFYNTAAGKGTIEHYLESAERHLYPQHL